MLAAWWAFIRNNHLSVKVFFILLGPPTDQISTKPLIGDDITKITFMNMIEGEWPECFLKGFLIIKGENGFFQWFVFLFFVFAIPQVAISKY